MGDFVFRVVGTPCFRKCTGFEVSYDDIVIIEVEKKVKFGSEIGLSAGYRGHLNVVNVDGDVVYGGCNGEVLSDGVGGEVFSKACGCPFHADE